MDSMQKAIVTNAIYFADQMRKSENADLLAVWLNFVPKDDILDGLYYSEERRQEWRNHFHEEMPDNTITADQFARLSAIEHDVDNQPEAGHSGSSWSYMVAVAKCILGSTKWRSNKYMNWINQAEEIRAGSTEPLTEANIAANKRAGYNEVTKSYEQVAPAEVE